MNRNIILPVPLVASSFVFVVLIYQQREITHGKRQYQPEWHLLHRTWKLSGVFPCNPADIAAVKGHVTRFSARIWSCRAPLLFILTTTQLDPMPSGYGQLFFHPSFAQNWVHFLAYLFLLFPSTPYIGNKSRNAWAWKTTGFFFFKGSLKSFMALKYFLRRCKMHTLSLLCFFLLSSFLSELHLMIFNSPKPNFSASDHKLLLPKATITCKMIFF